MTTAKALYHGRYNYSRQVYDVWCRANGPVQAHALLCNQVAIALGRKTCHDMAQYFDGRKPNYQVFLVEELSGKEKEVTQECLRK